MNDKKIITSEDVENAKKYDSNPIIIEDQNSTNIKKDEIGYLSELRPLTKITFTYKWINVLDYIDTELFLKYEGMEEGELGFGDEDLYDTLYKGLKNIHPIAFENRDLKHDELTMLKTSIKLTEGLSTAYPIILTNNLQILDGRSRLYTFFKLGYTKIYASIINENIDDSELYAIFRSFESGRQLSYLDKLILNMKYFDRIMNNSLNPRFKMKDITKMIKYSILGKDELILKKISDETGIKEVQLKESYFIWLKDKTILQDISIGKKYVSLDGLPIGKIKLIFNDLTKRNNEKLEEDLIGKCFSYKEEIERGNYISYITKKYPKYITERKEKEIAFYRMKLNNLNNF